MSLGTDLSAADVALLSGNNRNNGYGFGDNGAWWIILFLIFGWGNNGGWSNNGGGYATQGALTRGDLCMDMNFQGLENSVRNIGNGICSLGYDQLNRFNGLEQNFSNLNSTICQQQYDTAAQLNALGSAIQSGFNAVNVVALQGQNAVQAQISDCCCTTKQAIAETNYNIATQSCDTRNVIQNTTRDMIDNANANTRAILDKLTQQEIEAKNAQIASLNQQLFRADLAASQNAQNAYLVNQLAPKCPIPAFLTCNPYTGQSYTNGYGYGNAYNNCGCNSGCCGCNG